jgi:hypothetical protein
LSDTSKRLYEDNITGKLTDERFIKLSREVCGVGGDVH